jgi:hypothetical protein
MVRDTFRFVNRLTSSRPYYVCLDIIELAGGWLLNQQNPLGWVGSNRERFSAEAALVPVRGWGWEG